MKIVAYRDRGLTADGRFYRTAIEVEGDNGGLTKYELELIAGFGINPSRRRQFEDEWTDEIGLPPRALDAFR